MTQTQSTKTPTRAGSIKIVIDDVSAVPPETVEKFIKILDDLLQIKRPTTATDAPIVEGLDEALQMVKANFQIREKIPMSQIGDNLAAIEKVERAAKLYAQGRTQSAVPEGWKLVPIELSPDMKGAGELAFLKAKGWASHQAVPTIYKSLLSAAPPVTGGAWRKVDPDNIYQGYFAWLDEDSDDQEPIVCAWPPMDKYAKCFKRGYYYPLPDPPSSAEKEGV